MTIYYLEKNNLYHVMNKIQAILTTIIDKKY